MYGKAEKDEKNSHLNRILIRIREYYYLLNTESFMIKVEKEGDNMLTNMILVLVLVAAGAYGYYLTFRLDGWLTEDKKQKLKEEEAQSGEACALLFGSGSRMKLLEQWVRNHGLLPIVIEEIGIRREWNNICLVIAASESDEDNLCICKLIQKMYHTEQVYGICNDRLNEAMYDRFHIRILKENAEITRQLEGMFQRNEAGVA